MVGTIEYRVGDRVLPAVNTTPESLDLAALMKEVSAAGGSHVTLEASSHALSLCRIYGLRFHTAVFTNLTRDHLDFHGTMEEYFEAKHRLFQGAGGPPLAWAVVDAGRRVWTPHSVRAGNASVEIQRRRARGPHGKRCAGIF